MTFNMVKPMMFFIVLLCVLSLVTENVVGKSYGKHGKQHGKQHSKKSNYEAKAFGKSHGKSAAGCSMEEDSDGSCSTNGQCKTSCGVCERNATVLDVPCNNDLVCCETFESIICPGQCVQDCCGIPLECTDCSEGTICCTSRDESINHDFYPFGVKAEDNCITSLSSNWESVISVTDGIPIFGYISENLIINSYGFLGFLSLDIDINIFSIDMSFPTGEAFIWYRTADTGDLNRISTEIQSTFEVLSFVPTFAIVITYDNARLTDDPDLKSTFQCILATDGTSTYSIFVYDEINFEAYYVGFALPGWNSFSLPSTDSALTTLTNVGKPGKFVFKIDGTIEGPPGF